MQAFTKTLIERASRPPGITTHVLTDSKTAGLQCFIGSKTKTFYAVFHMNGKPYRHKVGRFPQTTVEYARAEANRIAVAVQQGKDPRRKTDMNLLEAFEYTVERRTLDEKMSEATEKSYRGVLMLHCKDWLKRDILSITEDEIAELKYKLAESSKSTANIVLAILSIIWKTRRAPKFNVSKYSLPARKNKSDDWQGWHKAVKALDQTKRNCLLFIAFTGLRSENARSLTWPQVDLEKGTAHFAKTKTTRDVTLPLSDDALSLIKQQKALDDAWVFPASRGKGHIIELRDDDVIARVHDLRRLFTSSARRAMLPDYCVAMLRADKAGTVRDGYDQETAPKEWAQKVAEQIRLKIGA